MLRLVRNLGSFAPMFIGAYVGSRLNRTETRHLAEAIAVDLSTRSVIQA
jgi:hypothetical protein